MFEAILFDNDGILIDTERRYVQACQEIVFELFGKTLDIEIYNKYGYTLGTGTTGWLKEQGVSDVEIQKYQQQRDRRYEKLLSQRIDPMEGILNVLDFLLNQEIPRAIVTATYRPHLELAHSQTELLNYFPFAITNEDVSQGKPFPDGYLLAAQKLGVSPEKCLVIEDSPRGIKAGKMAGMTVWAVPTDQTKNLDLSRADEVFSSLHEILAKLQTTK